MAPDGMEPAVVSHPAHGTVLACWYANGAVPDSAIAELAEKVLRGQGGRPAPDLEAILAADRRARADANRLIEEERV